MSWRGKPPSWYELELQRQEALEALRLIESRRERDREQWLTTGPQGAD